MSEVWGLIVLLAVAVVAELLLLVAMLIWHGLHHRLRGFVSHLAPGAARRKAREQASLQVALAKLDEEAYGRKASAIADLVHLPPSAQAIARLEQAACDPKMTPELRRLAVEALARLALRGLPPGYRR